MATREKIVSLSNYNGIGLVNTPRSKEVLRRLGIAPDDICRKIQQDFESEGLPAAEAALRTRYHDARRKQLMEQIMAEYIQYCRKGQRDGEDDSLHTAKLKKLAEDREKEHHILLRKNRQGAARIIAYVLQQEHSAATAENKRVQRETALTEKLRQKTELQRQRNTEKREATQQRLQSASERERQEMQQKMGRIQEKIHAQEEAVRAMKQRQTQETETRRKENEIKQKIRLQKKEKAFDDEQARKSQSLQRIKQQEINLQRKLAQAEQERKERQLRLSLQNEGVSYAVVRTKRVLEYKKEKMQEKVDKKSALVQKLTDFKAQFVEGNKKLTEEELSNRKMMRNWIESIKVTKQYSVPSWVNIDLKPYIPFLEMERALHPDVDFDQVIREIRKEHQFYAHHVPNIPLPEKIFYSKPFWEGND